MLLTQLETELRRVAHEKIEKGQLPHLVPKSMWGGKGAGQRCALCDKAIEAEDFELAVEQRLGGKAQALHFHVFCHSLWKLECARPKPGGR